MPQMKIIKFVALAIALGLIVLAWQPVKKLLLQDSCLDAGGKWASNGNYCIYRECAENNSCKPSFRNNEICSGLKLGVSQDLLYFHLGMPESQNGAVYTFSGGGGNSKIIAKIKSGKVVVLDCGA